MKRSQIYLSLILLAVFTLPKAYQDLHIIFYHGNIHIHADLNHHWAKSFAEKEDSSCKVRDYEFAVSNIHLPALFDFTIESYNIFFTRKVFTKTHNYSGFHFSLRAPPNNFQNNFLSFI